MIKKYDMTNDYFDNSGSRMYQYADELFPINRSLMGDGVRKTLDIISAKISEPWEDYTGDMPKLQIFEVPTGSLAYDWTVPKEWVIRDAYIENESGEHIIDFKDNNLHVLGYSTKVDRWVDLSELKNFVYTEKGQPDAIPYVTSYYKERYGFCMSENKLNSLKDGKYHMYIDSELKDGSLTYGELLIEGSTDEEILFSTYVCHPSMANNECSGPALAIELIRYLASLKDRKYTYRFVFVPETLGSIVYLSNLGRLKHFKEKLKAGYILSCVGDNNNYSMISSKYADTLADRALNAVLRNKINYTNYSFRERGSDERQYNAAGVDLPVVCFCRSKFGNFPEYHTSLDNMSFISKEGLQGSFEAITELINLHENNDYYLMNVLCEPQLGKRGLYSDISRKGIYDSIMVQRDVISYADGRNDVIDMCDIIGATPNVVISILERLDDNDLITRK